MSLSFGVRNVAGAFFLKRSALEQIIGQPLNSHLSIPLGVESFRSYGSVIRRKLGPYEILGLIDAGGMGEVYLARDSRLGRNVAIKVSAERFNERFEHEGRAVAA